VPRSDATASPKSPITATTALGRRISKTDAFGSTHYLWDGDMMVQSQRASRQAVLFVYEPNSFVPLTTVQSKYLALRLWRPTVR